MINIKKEKRIIKITILSFTLYLISMLIWECFIYTIVNIGFLSFLGFTYKSYLSVILFFTICYIMLLPVDYYSSILIGLLKSKNNVSKFQQRVLDFILYSSFSSLVIGSVDFFMEDIHISPANQVLLIILYYLFESYFDYLLLRKK